MAGLWLLAGAICGAKRVWKASELEPSEWVKEVDFDRNFDASVKEEFGAKGDLSGDVQDEKKKFALAKMDTVGGGRGCGENPRECNETEHNVRPDINSQTEAHQNDVLVRVSVRSTWRMRCLQNMCTGETKKR
jgi:hypothetical protein